MRTPLNHAMPPHNPLVEVQRPGFCVFIPARDQWIGGTTGVLVTGARRAHVYEHRWDAKRWADMFCGKVTTVPRFDGFTMTWTEDP